MSSGNHTSTLHPALTLKPDHSHLLVISIQARHLWPLDLDSFEDAADAGERVGVGGLEDARLEHHHLVLCPPSSDTVLGG